MQPVTLNVAPAALVDAWPPMGVRVAVLVICSGSTGKAHMQGCVVSSGAEEL